MDTEKSPEGESMDVLRGNGRVREVVRNGYHEDQEVLIIEEYVTAKHGTFDAGPPVEVQHAQARAKIPKGDAWFVLQALADYYNMELRAE